MANIAWLAGLLEGEGYFALQKNGNYLIPRIQLTMTDKDIVERAAAFIGTTAKAQPPSTPNRKPTWRLTLAKRSILEPLLKELLPYMGKRRQTRIKEMLNFYTTGGDNR